MRKMLIVFCWIGYLNYLPAAQTALPPLVQLVKDNNAFSFSTYRALPQKEGDNLIFSPYSIFSCLSMAYIGARTDTAYQMQRALQLNLSPAKLSSAAAQLAKLLAVGRESDSGYALSIANGLWVDPGTFLLADFRHTIEDDYQAKLQAIDFQDPLTIELINDWVENETLGKITDLLHKGDIGIDTRMVLANAIYFKGNWRHPFHPSKTRLAPFQLTQQNSIDVPMMEQTTSCLYFENGAVQLIALPFIPPKKTSSQIAYLLILPKSADLLSDLELNLSHSQLKQWLDQLSNRYVEIHMPKYTLQNRFNLHDPLEELGMQLPFTPRADFSGIDGLHDLFISTILHKTIFALDESGVTAAAATATGMSTTSLPTEPPILFQANHPFLFLLVDLNTQAVLFLGKLVHP